MARVIVFLFVWRISYTSNPSWITVLQVRALILYYLQMMLTLNPLLLLASSNILLFDLSPWSDSYLSSRSSQVTFHTRLTLILPLPFFLPNAVPYCIYPQRYPFKKERRNPLIQYLSIKGRNPLKLTKLTICYLIWEYQVPLEYRRRLDKSENKRIPKHLMNPIYWRLLLWYHSWSYVSRPNK